MEALLLVAGKHLLIVISQLGFAVTRTLHPKYVVRKEHNKVAINAMVGGGVNLLGIYIGVKGVEEGDVWMIMTYILSLGIFMYLTSKYTK